jgi:hypothetical protein
MAENNSYLNVYIGNPSGENWLNYLYLDLVIPGREVTLFESASLDDCSGADFLEYLEKAFNEARLYGKFLGLKLHVEMDEILTQIEDMEESEAKNARILLKEITED